VQLSADPLSFFLLRLQDLMGQMPQLLLHEARLLQQPALVLLSSLEGFFHRLPPDDFPFQLRFATARAPGGFALPRLLEGGDVRRPPPGTISADREGGREMP